MDQINTKKNSRQYHLSIKLKSYKINIKSTFPKVRRMRLKNLFNSSNNKKKMKMKMKRKNSNIKMEIMKEMKKKTK
jgi:hypothetical protein